MIAMDQGSPSLLNTTNLHITVTDINDNTPIIIPFLSTAEVKEVVICKSILASQLIYVYIDMNITFDYLHLAALLWTLFRWSH